MRLAAAVIVLGLVGCGELEDKFVFAPVGYDVTVDVAEDAPGRVVSEPEGIDCGDDCVELFLWDTDVTLTASTLDGGVFLGWTDACADETSLTCTFTINDVDREVIAGAVFAHEYELEVTLAGSGAGTVTGDGIDCGDDCAEIYLAGTVVTLTATPGDSSRFDGWSGACAGVGDCTVTLDDAQQVTATFTQFSRLEVLEVGSGAGVVTSDDGLIDCGSDCSEDYDVGTMVTLTATPDAITDFLGWSGGGCGAPAPCTVTLDAATQVTALFYLRTYPLTVVRDGTGSGTVTGDGIDCGPGNNDCTQDLEHGVSFPLAATPSVGSTFVGWSGAGCSGQGGCSVALTAADTVTATFDKLRYDVTVSKVGNAASGATITADVGALSCGADCAETYDHGTTVTLTASPAADFTGWSGGGCSGTGPCVIDVTDDVAVSAEFVTNTFWQLLSFSSFTIELVSYDLAGGTMGVRGSTGIDFAGGDCAYDAGSRKLFVTDGGTDQNLYEVDRRSGMGTLIGNHAQPTMSALAIHPPSGVLYALAGAEGQSLYTLDVTTGAATLVGATTGIEFGGMVWDSTRSRMVAVNQNDALKFYSINLTTGAATLLTSAATNYGGATGLTYAPGTDTFYVSAPDGLLHTFPGATLVESGFVAVGANSACVAYQ